MVRKSLTEDIVAGVRDALKVEIDSAVNGATGRLESSFSKGLSDVRDQIGWLTQKIAYFVDRADRQLEVHEKELIELRKFNTNAEAFRKQQREEMRELREAIDNLSDKLIPKVPARGGQQRT